MNILCGYNVNIDSVYRISGAEISELLNTFERTEILEKIENPPGKILSKSDFAAGLVYCMKNGCGAEWLVFKQSVFEFLKNRYFEKSLVRMGGNAGIMANALSELGASRVIPNVAVPSRTQLSLFSKKAVYFPDVSLQAKEKSGTKSGKNPDVPFSNQDPIHFVFDFSEGETFSLYGKEIRVPRENRFIATCDQLNFKLFVNPAFGTYALQHACEIDGVLISGFHLLLETYPDDSTYREVLENSFAQLKAWRARNDKFRVHLEFGHFGSKEIANSVFLKFAGISNSIGMNEDELAMLRNLHGIPAEGILRMEAGAVGEAACELASRHGIGKIFIHTREFFLAVFKPGSSGGSGICGGSGISDESGISNESGISDEPRVSGKWDDIDDPALLKAAEKKLEAMSFGLRCAGVYAASGRLEGREFVEKEASKLQESLLGREQLQLFLKAFHGKTFEHGAYALREGYVLCILPTLLSKSPLTTVGLGDTLTAATFLRELELDVQA
ncbi:ADP-dependent glucokinase/phosphofructokinase [Methanosarcina sp. T3]|uniref:ADP-dependent glucokinase/phosphofructokinase n=1 Tax=Methanosarcina sp. T3 TaxID=3439062 RepID=UPI003F82F7F5